MVIYLSAMQCIGIIPARYGSSRFPGKPLCLIHGKSMIQRVYEQAAKAVCLDEVVVATDDQRIYDHVEAFGGNVVMTFAHHHSGTDRCLEALNRMPNKYDIAINIQGDEPYLDPSQIEEVVALFTNDKTQIATLVKKIARYENLHNPNRVKVVFNHDKKALYFSRQAIPYLSGFEPDTWLSHYDYYRHIGIYAYRTKVLEAIAVLTPTALEKAESLEQLRWLDHGYNIYVAETDHEAFGIDTPEDLEQLNQMQP